MNLIQAFTASALVLATSSTIAASPVSPRVIDLCLDLKRPLKMCRCSARKLSEQAAAKDFNDYAFVSELYLRNKRGGMRRRPAWTNAVTELSGKSGEAIESLANRLDSVADQHRMTMQQCSRL